MFDYTDWANERMLAVLAGIDEDQLTRSLAGSFASVRETIAHIAGAEWIWLQRWKGNSPAAGPQWSREGSLAEIAEEMRRTAAERRELLAGMTESSLKEKVTYRNLSGTVSWHLRVGEMLLHVVNHSTYHRGQLASKLRELGIAPKPTDLLLYASENE
ncbi:MAG TPA: DinB family protein [Thermoanaerobaculia bacterium]|nr:DinB family protein [Thermoanaerobaculia bacterium]